MGLAIAPVTTVGNIEPSAQDIADFIPRRTIEVNGLPTGSFGETTSPTDSQAFRIGQSVAQEVLTAVPGLPASMYPQAKRVAALGAAAQIELAYFPEDADTVAKQLEDRYLKATEALTRAVELATGVDQPGDGTTGSGQAVPAAPAYNFPDLLGDRAAGGEWPFLLWPSDLWLYPNL